MEPCTLQRKGIPGLLVETRSQQRGEQLLAEMERETGVWETKAGMVATHQPSMEKPRKGDWGRDESHLRPRKHFFFFLSPKCFILGSIKRMRVALFKCIGQTETFAGAASGRLL